jgi:hypothetical protein
LAGRAAFSALLPKRTKHQERLTASPLIVN